MLRLAGSFYVSARVYYGRELTAFAVCGRTPVMALPVILLLLWPSRVYFRSHPLPLRFSTNLIYRKTVETRFSWELALFNSRTSFPFRELSAISLRYHNVEELS